MLDRVRARARDSVAVGCSKPCSWATGRLCLLPNASRSSRVLDGAAPIPDMWFLTPLRSDKSVNDALGLTLGTRAVSTAEWLQEGHQMPALSDCVRQLEALRDVPELGLSTQLWDNMPVTVLGLAEGIGRQSRAPHLALGWWTRETYRGFVAVTDWALAWRLNRVQPSAALWGVFASCAVLRQNQALIYWPSSDVSVRRRGAFIPTTYLSVILEKIADGAIARNQALKSLAVPSTAASYRYPPAILTGPDHLNCEVRFTVKRFNPRYLFDTLATIRTLCAAYDADVSGGTVVLQGNVRSSDQLEAFSLFRSRAEITQLLKLRDGSHATPIECRLLFGDTFITSKVTASDVDLFLDVRPDAVQFSV